MTTFNWTIANLEYTNDDAQGVVVAHWRVQGVEIIEDNIYDASAYGTQSFTPDPEADGYIAFADLTEATVLAWVWDQEEDWKTNVEQNIANKIESLKNPATLSGKPWDNQDV